MLSATAFSLPSALPCTPPPTTSPQPRHTIQARMPWQRCGNLFCVCADDYIHVATDLLFVLISCLYLYSLLHTTSCAAAGCLGRPPALSCLPHLLWLATVEERTWAGERRWCAVAWLAVLRKRSARGKGAISAARSHASGMKRVCALRIKRAARRHGRRARRVWRKAGWACGHPRTTRWRGRLALNL